MLILSGFSNILTSNSFLSEEIRTYLINTVGLKLPINFVAYFIQCIYFYHFVVTSTDMSLDIITVFEHGQTCNDAHFVISRDTRIPLTIWTVHPYLLHTPSMPGVFGVHLTHRPKSRLFLGVVV